MYYWYLNWYYLQQLQTTQIYSCYRRTICNVYSTREHSSAGYLTLVWRQRQTAGYMDMLLKSFVTDSVKMCVWYSGQNDYMLTQVQNQALLTSSGNASSTSVGLFYTRNSGQLLYRKTSCLKLMLWWGYDTSPQCYQWWHQSYLSHNVLTCFTRSSELNPTLIF